MTASCCFTPHPRSSSSYIHHFTHHHHHHFRNESARTSLRNASVVNIFDACVSQIYILFIFSPYLRKAFLSSLILFSLKKFEIRCISYQNVLPPLSPLFSHSHSSCFYYSPSHYNNSACVRYIGWQSKK